MATWTDLITCVSRWTVYVIQQHGSTYLQEEDQFISISWLVNYCKLFN